MKNQLYNIVKDISNKYGKEHSLSIKSARIISSFLKTSGEMPEVDKILEQSLDVNIEELKALFEPENYEFEVQEIGEIKVEK